MAGIIASVSDDIKKLQELKQAIADVKGELKSINIKVDVDIKENLEKQLQSLMSQYNAVAARISEVEGKVIISCQNIKKYTEQIIEAQNAVTVAASRQISQPVRPTDAQQSAVAENQQATLSIQAQAKAYKDLKESIEDVSNTKNQNLVLMLREIDKMKSYQKELKKLKEAPKTDETVEKIANITGEVEKSKIVISDFRRSIKNDLKIETSVSGSMNELSQQLGKMRSVYRDLAEEERNSPFGKELLASIQQADAKIKELDASIGNHQRNVGNYGSAFDSIRDKLNGFLSSASAMPGPLGNVAAGIQKMTKASLAFIATPIGIILAAIAAALAAVNSWFHRTEEGENALNVTTAVFSGTLNTLLDVVDNVGEWLFKCFTKPKEALSELVDFMKGQLINRLKAVAKGAEAIYKIFSGDMSGVQDFQNAWSQGLSGIEDAGKKINTVINKSISNAKERAKLAERQNVLDRRERENLVEKAKLEQRISELREKSADTSVPARERVKATKEAKELTEKMYDNEISLAKERYEIIKKTNSLSNSNKADKEAEARAEAEIYRLEGQRNNNLRMLARQSNRERNSQNAVTEANDKLDDITRKNAEERLKMEENLEERLTDARIKAMKDGVEKVLVERERQNEKELKQIEEQRKAAIEAELKRQKQEFDAKQDVIKAQGGRVVQWDESMIDTDVIDQINMQYKEIAESVSEAQKNTLLKAELQSMRDYLKEYGTYQQQKLAIAEEYAEKIAKAQTVGEKASLTMEQNNKLKELEKSEFENSVDWTGIFSELKGHTKDYLENLRDQLQSVIREGTLPPDQLATVQEKLREINEAISEQSGAFSFIGDKAREHARLINEAADAQKRLTSAQEKEATNKKNVDDIIEQIRLRLGESGLENVDIDDNLLSQLSPLSDEFKVMSGLLVDLRVAEGKLADARRKTEKATKEAENAEDASKRASAQAMADWFADAQQFIAEKGIDQLPELFNSLGMGGIGNKLSSGLSGLNSAAGAAADFATGNYIGALTKGFSAIKSFGSALGIGGGNAAEVAETINRLTDRNELLTVAIEDLTDEMKSAKGASAIDASERARELQKETNENYKEMAQAQAGYHSAHRSFNYYWGGYSQEQIDRLSQQIGRKWSGDLWDLSPEEMKILRSNIDMWEQIQNTGKGNYGGRVADKLNDYIDQAGKLEEITDALYENLTTTTSENVFDDFLNSLYELADGSEDVMDNIAENWQKMVNRMVVNNLVGAKFQQDLENWYERLAKLNESRTKGEITDDEYRKELEELRVEYEDKVNSAKNDLESLRESGIIKETSDMDKQEASGKGFQTMSQDTGEELNGRFTAMYESELRQESAMEQQTVAITAIKDNMMSLYSKMDGLGNIADDMRTTIVNSFLELQDIRENTGAIVKPILQMQKDIAEVKQNTSRL